MIGIGKTTVARIYAKFLHSVGIIGSNEVLEISGATLAYMGPEPLQDKINTIVEEYQGGVLFVDEAYQLTAPHTSVAGRQALDLLLSEMENNIGKLVVIFAGYNKEMQSFFEHNPGLSSRIPYILQFEDFDVIELWTILRDRINKKYGEGRMNIEGGEGGLYMRIATRRLARGRGIRGFGNARSVDNLLSRISERQAKRLDKEKKKGRLLDKQYFCFTKADLIGPDPSEAIHESEAWVKLNGLVGLEAVKQSASSMLEILQVNYKRELEELKPLDLSLNQVFVGSPGTGKTTVAKLYGKIMADLGLLTDGEGMCYRVTPRIY